MATRDLPNFYDVLEVDPCATRSAIRSQYRLLMQAGGHPDLGGDVANAALINKAYAVLSNSRRREEYDAELAALQEVERIHGGGPVTTRSLDPNRECLFCTLPHERRGVPEAVCARCSSPLAPVERVRMELRDQRAIARIEKRIDVTFYADWRQQRAFAGRSEDMSLHGMRLVTKRGLRDRQCIRITSGFFEAVGAVTNASVRRQGWKTEHLTGISFLTLRFFRSVGGFVSKRV